MGRKFERYKKFIVIGVFLIITVFAIYLMGKVKINYDISDYLNDKTETKISLDIIKSDFGMTGTIQVLIENITADKAKDVRDVIKKVDNVLTVSFDENDESYYKDSTALFIAVVDGDDYSETANNALSDIKESLEKEFDGRIVYGGAVVEKADLRKTIESEVPFILFVAICLVVAIMLLTSKSWFEPILLLLGSGVAIIINLGTNVIFGQISYITNAVAAILQLALSIDYSIVLIHGYRRIKESEPDKYVAMKAAIKTLVKPISASALTTMAGLLALLFMSIKIGFDFGIVLMKGILISAVVSVTLLPSLLLLFDKPLHRFTKKDIVLRGKPLCEVAFKASKVIVPVALVMIIICCGLHFGNKYSFTITDNTNPKIVNTFGKNNAVIVVYPNTADSNANEIKLGDRLIAYKTASGKNVLKSYTAYSNTVRELYDVKSAAEKLDLDESDIKMLFTMYHLYKDEKLLEISPLEFVEQADYLINNDPDAEDFNSEEITDTIGKMLLVNKILTSDLTAEEFHILATTGALKDTNIDLFSVKQMYGLYLYNQVENPRISFEELLDYMVALSSDDTLADMFDESMKADLESLTLGVKIIKAILETPYSQGDFKAYMADNYGFTLDDETVAGIFGGYFTSNGIEPEDSVPLIELLYFMTEKGMIEKESDVKTITEYKALIDATNASYSYDEIIPAMSVIAELLTGKAAETSANEYLIQQVYILYFYEKGMIPDAKINGHTFINFINDTVKTNPVVEKNLGDDEKDKLSDALLADGFLSDTEKYGYVSMTEKIRDLQRKVKSMETNDNFSSDKVSGVYIKYAVNNSLNLTEGIEAKDILDFVTENMDTNELMKVKISEENKSQVNDAQDDIKSATDLFISDRYSRMILSIDLPNEGKESSEFVAYLLSSVKEIFGEDAHIAGEIVSTNDLKESFSYDNTLISVFTIIAVFVIVMIIFRSISLPVILVAVIQGAIWIAMSTSLITGPMFFMSYIVANCILMGATIDYGILMSTNYVKHRLTLDRKEALLKSIEAAMPTVFTSGLILTVCGFVDGIISKQNAISMVGILLGKGTIVSILMITLVLPSVLYLLDGFIMKLSLKKKAKTD